MSCSYVSGHDRSPFARNHPIADKVRRLSWQPLSIASALAHPRQPPHRPQYSFSALAGSDSLPGKDAPAAFLESWSDRAKSRTYPRSLLRILERQFVRGFKILANLPDEFKHDVCRYRVVDSSIDLK